MNFKLGQKLNKVLQFFTYSHNRPLEIYMLHARLDQKEAIYEIKAFLKKLALKNLLISCTCKIYTAHRELLS